MVIAIRFKGTAARSIPSIIQGRQCPPKKETREWIPNCAAFAFAFVSFI
jgi:hypothetical protein